MSSAPLVPVHPAWRRALPWLPAVTCAGRVYVSPTGEAYRAQADGALDQVLPGGMPHGGPAVDPANSGRSRRYA